MQHVYVIQTMIITYMYSNINNYWQNIMVSGEGAIAPYSNISGGRVWKAP